MKSTINNILNTSYYIENKDPLSIEIGIDEAGRGPMFGRVYAAAVVLLLSFCLSLSRCIKIEFPELKAPPFTVEHKRSRGLFRK